MLRQHRYIRPAQLHINQSRLKSLGIARAVAGRNAILQAHSAQLVEGSKETSDFLSSLLQVFDRHHQTVSQSGVGYGGIVQGSGEIKVPGVILFLCIPMRDVRVSLHLWSRPSSP